MTLFELTCAHILRKVASYKLHGAQCARMSRVSVE